VPITRGVSSPTAERALDFTRYELQHAGNPAYTAVAVNPDGSCEMGAMIVTNPVAAAHGARALATENPDATVHIVGCNQGGLHLRYVVLDASGSERHLVREEVRDEPLGGRSEML
jgi:hypothetical protein